MVTMAGDSNGGGGGNGEGLECDGCCRTSLVAARVHEVPDLEALSKHGGKLCRVHHLRSW